MVGRWRTPGWRVAGWPRGATTDERGTDDHGTAHRARRDIPVPGDSQPPHARLDGGDVRPVHRPGRLLVRQAARPRELPARAGSDLPAAPGRGPLPAGSPLLGGRPDVRHRVPHTPRRGAGSRRCRGAGPVRGGRVQPPTRSHQTAVGDVHRRRTARRADRRRHQDPPLHHRRGLRCRAAVPALRPRARPGATPGSRDACHLSTSACRRTFSSWRSRSGPA